MVFADFFVITFKKFTIEFYKKIKFESRFFSLPEFYIERLLSNFFLREQTSARNTDSLLYLSCQKRSFIKKYGIVKFYGSLLWVFYGAF
jgi:hypothetical protein